VGGGNAVTNVLSEAARIELSTELEVLRFESFSSSGGKVSAGILITSAPRLS